MKRCLHGWGDVGLGKRIFARPDSMNRPSLEK